MFGKINSCRSNPKSNTTRKCPEFETIIVKYSPEIFDEKPTRKPFGLVVVKPTRMLSEIVDRHEPRKSYLTNDDERILTPISGNIRKKCNICYNQSSTPTRSIMNYHQHKSAP